MEPSRYRHCIITERPFRFTVVSAPPLPSLLEADVVVDHGFGWWVTRRGDQETPSPPFASRVRRRLSGRSHWRGNAALRTPSFASLRFGRICCSASDLPLLRPARHLSQQLANANMRELVVAAAPLPFLPSSSCADYGDDVTTTRPCQRRRF